MVAESGVDVVMSAGGPFALLSARDHVGAAAPVPPRPGIRPITRPATTPMASMTRSEGSGDLAESTDLEMVLFGFDALTAFVTPARLLHEDGPKAAQRALQAMQNLLGIQD